MRQTTMAKPADVTRTWYVVDGNGQTLGRLASTTYHVRVTSAGFAIVV